MPTNRTSSVLRRSSPRSTARLTISWMVCQSIRSTSMAWTYDRAASITFKAKASNISVKRPCGSAHGT